MRHCDLKSITDCRRKNVSEIMRISKNIGLKLWMVMVDEEGVDEGDVDTYEDYPTEASEGEIFRGGAGGGDSIV